MLTPTLSTNITPYLNNQIIANNSVISTNNAILAQASNINSNTSMPVASGTFNLSMGLLVFAIVYY